MQGVSQTKPGLICKRRRHLPCRDRPHRVFLRRHLLLDTRHCPKDCPGPLFEPSARTTGMLCPSEAVLCTSLGTQAENVFWWRDQSAPLPTLIRRKEDKKEGFAWLQTFSFLWSCPFPMRKTALGIRRGGVCQIFLCCLQLASVPAFYQIQIRFNKSLKTCFSRHVIYSLIHVKFQKEIKDRKNYVLLGSWKESFEQLAQGHQALVDRTGLVLPEDLGFSFSPQDLGLFVSPSAPNIHHRQWLQKHQGSRSDVALSTIQLQGHVLAIFNL